MTSFEALLAEASADENVVGVVLFGSRGKGAFVDERSDWDVFVVVREHRGERPFVHGAVLETVETTLDELRSPPAWNRYSLAWLEPQLDKTGEVAAALRDAVRVDPVTAGEPLDAYVNSYYRSAKNARLERIAHTGDITEQQALFRDAESLARSHGLGTVIDTWEPDVAWLRGDES